MNKDINVFKQTIIILIQEVITLSDKGKIVKVNVVDKSKYPVILFELDNNSNASLNSDFFSTQGGDIQLLIDSDIVNLNHPNLLSHLKEISK